MTPDPGISALTHKMDAFIDSLHQRPGRKRGPVHSHREYPGARGNHAPGGQ